jgi:tRNA pseudouridine55 synthase
MNGVLLVDKPKDWTSFDVVAKVRSTLKKNLKSIHEIRGFCTEVRGKEVVGSAERRTNKYAERAVKPTDTAMHSEPTGATSFAGQQSWRCKCRVKVGHCGTLDPLATGLLVIVVGDYCKRASEFTKLDKIYEVDLTLGKTSTTDDEEGEKTSTNKPIPNQETIERVITSFVGEIEQTPPAFSAVKVNGKRAYKLAREGKNVELKPRDVTIYAIDAIQIKDSAVTFRAKVSSGTYIRSLARDIGEKLGCGAYMSNLRRTQVGDFSLYNAHGITDIASRSVEKLLLHTSE